MSFLPPPSFNLIPLPPVYTTLLMFFRPRSDYVARLRKDFCLYYSYNEFLMEKLMEIFPLDVSLSIKKKKIQCDGLADCCQITMNTMSHAFPHLHIGGIVTLKSLALEKKWLKKWLFSNTQMQKCMAHRIHSYTISANPIYMDPDYNSPLSYCWGYCNLSIKVWCPARKKSNFL